MLRSGTINPTEPAHLPKTYFKTRRALQKGVEKVRQNVPKVRLSDPCFQRNFLSFNHLQREDDIPPPFHTNRISIAICRFLVPARISVLKSIRSEALKQNGALKSRGLSRRTNVGHWIGRSLTAFSQIPCSGKQLCAPIQLGFCNESALERSAAASSTRPCRA